MSPWNLKPLFYPQIGPFFPQKFCACTQSSISDGFSWTRHSLWVTSFLLNATVFLPLQKGKEGPAVWNDTIKVAQDISVCTYLLVMEVNAPVTMLCDERSMTHCQLLGDLHSVAAMRVYSVFYVDTCGTKQRA